ncbi:hypothetical protein LTR08_006795 [Meristemomyces frigidus]|nr:hypothetical protein LTR08_006795 [Meristemomyces frigidus]
MASSSSSSSQQSTSHLLKLPPELRLMIYEFYIVRPDPMPWHQIRTPPRDIRSLWQINQLIRKETYHTRDDFIRLNTFDCGPPINMDPAGWPASSRTRALLTTIYLDLRSLSYPLGPVLDPLSTFTNLRTLVLGSVDPLQLLPYAPPYALPNHNWQPMHVAQEAKQYASQLTAVVRNVRPLPTGLVLRVRGLMRAINGGVQFSAAFRYLGAEEWAETLFEMGSRPKRQVRPPLPHGRTANPTQKLSALQQLDADTEAAIKASLDEPLTMESEMTRETPARRKVGSRRVSRGQTQVPFRGTPVEENGVKAEDDGVKVEEPAVKIEEPTQPAKIEAPPLRRSSRRRAGGG